MAMFTLVVRPDGRAILAAARRLTDSEKREVAAEVRRWEGDDRPSVLVVDGCDVVQVATIEIDLERTAVPA